MNYMLTPSEVEAMNAATFFTDSNQMFKYAPSLFTTTAHPKMSSKYGFTNTYDILLHMHNKGFPVVAVHGGDKKYKKVLVRMRSIHHDERDGARPEVIALDSHDGSSRLHLALGAITGVCLNGMIAGDMIYKRSFVHRSPDLMAKVMLELMDIGKYIDKLIQRIRDMRNHKTTFEDRMVLANTVITSRWGDEKDPSFVMDMRQRLLEPRRAEDHEIDMYTVMNVIQENALRGGMSYISNNNRLTNVRPISDVRRNLNINQQLWNSAEELLQKAA